MNRVLLGAVGMLALQALLLGALLSMDSLDPIILNPDDDLSKGGVAMIMLCSEARQGHTPGGRGSVVLNKMVPNGNVGAWTRGSAVRPGCDIWYHHGPLYNPLALEECLIGCDHDLLERWLR